MKRIAMGALRVTVAWLAIGACGTTAGAALAEPVYDRLREALDKPYFRVGVLLQSVADFQADRVLPGENGFSVANARLRLSGDLDERVDYLLQTNFAAVPSILDARVGLGLSERVEVGMGLFKVPFSQEFLTGAGNIDFVNRSQVVTAFAPGRQMGVSVSGWLRPGVARLSAGLFNGNRGGVSQNDNGQLLYVARLSLRRNGGDEGRLDAGVNVAASRDDAAALPGVAPSFAGRRVLAGGDVRFTRDRLLLAGELIVAHLSPQGRPDADPFGFHLTAGYMLDRRSQVLIRWDALEGDGLAPDSHWLVFGYNLWYTAVLELQANYVLDTDATTHQLLVNAQVQF